MEVSQLLRDTESPCLAKPIEYPVLKYHPEPFELVKLFPLVSPKTTDRAAAAKRVNVELLTGAAAMRILSPVQLETTAGSSVVPATFMSPE